MTCCGDPYLSLTEKSIWSGKATQHSLMTARKIQMHFPASSLISTKVSAQYPPWGHQHKENPEIEESVIPDQACSCWVPAGTSTPLFYASRCVADCRGARRAVPVRTAVTDISSHLSVGRSTIHKWASRRESLGRRRCECTALPFTRWINPTEAAVLHTCKYSRNSNPQLCKRSGRIRLRTLTQHCHPRNRWVLAWDASALPRLK